MEENQAFVGKDDTIQVKSPNGNCSELNDPLLAESDNLNIATMSDFQFNESLDALVDISFTENLTTAPQTSPDIPSCFGVDETALTRTTAAPEPPPAPQQPVTVHDNSYGSFSVNTSSSNNLVQQQSAPASNSFFPNVTATPLMMPFDTQAFLATGATQNNNFAPTSFMPPLSLQNSIEAFGQSISSQNFNHMYPVTSMPSFMCVPPTTHQLSTSFSTLPMVGSSMTLGGPTPSSTSATGRKRGHNSTFPISEDESDFRKRKSDRNAREQQRAQQVTDQIAHLRDLIVRSGVTLDKVDKFSTLIAVEQYIRSLQSKSLELKEEHENLLSTLQQTSELVNSQYVASASPNPVSSGGEESGNQAQDSSDQDTDDHSSEEDTTTMSMVKDINYKWIFDCCPFATGVASIDGRFLDCNKEFEVMTGYTRAELLPLEDQAKDDEKIAGTEGSLASTTPDDVPRPPLTPKKTRNMSIFNVLHRECIERLFCAMSTVLQKSNDTDGCDEEDKNEPDNEEKCSDTITQEVTLCKRSNQKVSDIPIDLSLMSCVQLFIYVSQQSFSSPPVTRRQYG